MLNQKLIAIVILVIYLLYFIPLFALAEETNPIQIVPSAVQNVKTDNAAIYYNRAFEMCTYTYKKGNSLSEKVEKVVKNGWNDESKELEELLKQNEPTFTEFEKGVNLEKCDFTFGKVYDNPYTYPIPNLLKVRSLSGLILLQGRKYEKQNNYEEAIKRYISLLNFMKHISQDKMLISIMMGRNIENIALQPIQQYLESKEINAKLNKKILSSLQYISLKRSTLVDGIEAEKQGYLWLGRGAAIFGMFNKEIQDKIAQSNKRPLAIDTNFATVLSESFNEAADKYYNLLMQFSKTNSETDRKNFENEFEALIKKVDLKSDPSVPLLELMSLVTTDPAKRDKKMADAIAEVCIILNLPNLQKAADQYYFCEAKFRILETASAMRAYIIEKGKLPDTLNELVPDYFGNIPIDPWSGQALKYVKKDTGFIIYSFGPDRTDNNGQGTGYEENIKELEGKDIVFSALTVF